LYNVIPYITIALCVIAIEIGWIAAVRWVHSNKTMHVVLSALSMQAISNASTLILVDNHWTMFASIIGGGLGALIGMKIPSTWFEKYDPSN